MFTLFYGIWNYFLKKGNFFVIILGLDNSGKTTFLEHARCKFVQNYRRVDLTRLVSTVGLNVGRIELDGIVLNFWDLGGQRELQLLWDKYFLEAHALIWVIDSCDKNRLQESSEALDKIIYNKHLQDLPLLFVLNKQDLKEAIDTREILEIFQPSLSKLGARPFLPIPVSALKGTGLKEALNWISEQVKLSPKPPSEK